MSDVLKELERSFENKELFLTALTHSSYANEHRDVRPSYERLEFLGDSVLGICVSDYLYRQHPDLSEGELSRLRSSVVCEKSLASVAEGLKVGEAIFLGRGEEQSNSRKRASILADVVEAIIGAVYLDAGMEKANRLVLSLLCEKLEDILLDENEDYKTRLQEAVQRRSKQPLSYRVTAETGLEHEKQFTVAVEHAGQQLGVGVGRNKKEAEQQAAKVALHRFENFQKADKKA